MIRRLFFMAVFFVICGQAMAQVTDREYYEPYVIPVSFAGRYVTIEYGSLMASNAPVAEAYTVGMLSHILQGTYKPRFKSIIAGEAGWTFPKTKISTLELRRFGVTGDVSVKVVVAPFDLTEPTDKGVTASYTREIGSLALGAGVNFNYRFKRKHFLKFGFKVYPTMLVTPDLFVEIRPDDWNGTQSWSVITASTEHPFEDDITSYVPQGTPVFSFQYALGADVILFKKLMVGFGYHHALIDADYTYYNQNSGAMAGPGTTEKKFKANLNYSHVSLRAGFYFSRGYKQ